MADGVHAERWAPPSFEPPLPWRTILCVWIACFLIGAGLRAVLRPQPAVRLVQVGGIGVCRVYLEQPTGRTVIICPPGEGRRL